MRQNLNIDNYVDQQGNPTGGFVHGVGLDIKWQDGPLVHKGARTEPNGAFVEGVIEAALKRLEFYQATKFECVENANAISALRSALDALEARTFRREAAGVEGKHEGK